MTSLCAVVFCKVVWNEEKAAFLFIRRCLWQLLVQLEGLF